MNKRPSVHDIDNWDILYDREHAIVAVGRIMHNGFEHDVYRVKPVGYGRVKYFWGESAWMNAQRYAHDHGALDCVL